MSSIGKTGPTIDRLSSKQDYKTPKNFIEAVVVRFGLLSHDLAADEHNTQAPSYFDKEVDSLSQDWGKLKGNLWLNPPFARIEPWAEKCARTEYSPDRRILFLVPGSVGSEWYRNYVAEYAYVLALSPRLTFVGCKDPYPKDCILAIYGHGLHGFDTWRWDTWLGEPVQCA